MISPPFKTSKPPTVVNWPKHAWIWDRRDRWSTLRFCETTEGLNALPLTPLHAKQVGKLENWKAVSPDLFHVVWLWSSHASLDWKKVAFKASSLTHLSGKILVYHKFGLIFIVLAIVPISHTENILTKLVSEVWDEAGKGKNIWQSCKL